ncbi:MAG: tyrosine-type recombinase/integrase, partial [Acidimicrobiales bacterium]|nr:tyrosine-type recombinase/integrase [Acidimicrobiales bacterium]
TNRRQIVEERLAMGDGWPNHNLVFTHADGRLLHPERFSREFTRRIERYDLPVIRLHDLRHTWATLALKAGIHPKVVQERLGHATINVTLDTYSHVTPGMQRDAAETIASMISGQA